MGNTIHREPIPYIGELLVKNEVITSLQLNQALSLQKEPEMHGKKIGEILLSLKYLSEKDICIALSYQLNIQFVSLMEYSINDKAVAKLSSTLAKRHVIIPINIDDQCLTVAMANPTDLAAIEDISLYCQMKVKCVVACKSEIQHCIDTYYGILDVLAAATRYKRDSGADDEVDNSPAVQTVQSIVNQAISTGASDIHIEPFSDRIRVRFRVDGQLKNEITLNADILDALVTRIKVISDMNISEKRKPQDGRLAFKLFGDINMRVSIIPTIHGEKVVIRLNNTDRILHGQDPIIYFDDDRLKYKTMLNNSHGIILVSGPTGSGKSTTLYYAIDELNKKNINIVTVEDPVEVSVDGVNQVQVNAKAGVDFNDVLRFILRQDPDVIMVGEIRDQQTANIAMRAAITGHLVLSTLHTNDSCQVIARLIDMDVEHYLIQAGLIGVISQRLVRKICRHCKTKYTPFAFEINAINQVVPILEFDGFDFYKGQGCGYCNNTGYNGRIAVFEILPMSNSIRELINANTDMSKIKAKACDEGMITLKENCVRLIKAGLTTIEEFISTCMDSEGGGLSEKIQTSR